MSIARIIILFIILIAWLAPSHASEIQFMTHNTEGKVYQDENGELRGKEHVGRRAFNLELISEMMILLDHPRTFTNVPFSRDLLFVQNKPNYALFNVTRKSSRENKSKWVGPLQQNDKAYFYVLKAAHTGIKTLADAKN